MAMLLDDRLRAGELVALPVTDIDLSAGALRPNRPKVKKRASTATVQKYVAETEIANAGLAED